MDNMERVGQLQRRMAAACPVIIAMVMGALAVSGCVADDPISTSLDSDITADTARVMPTVSTPVPDEDHTQDSQADIDGGDAEPVTTISVPDKPLQGLAAELVADGFDQPILVTSVPGTSAMIVVERKGIVRVVNSGEIQPEPFLDLTDHLLSSSIEQGLLGFAFHPNYEQNGRLFAYWTDPEGDSVLAEFKSQGANPPAIETLKVILQVDQPAQRHNAGMIEFGPEGLLYLSLGDGGSGGSTAQDTSNLLGSIVRIDVDTADPYAIPDGNPFGDEIWVYGLRNPWRFTIDDQTRRVYIGDVGQDSAEEINVVDLDGAGTNFGWAQAEGSRCFKSGCDLDAYTGPIVQYSHDLGCSVTGGVVYRGGALPELVGHYFFADWCQDLVVSFRYDDGKPADRLDWGTDLAALGQVTSFGVDADGEMHTVNWDGELHKIIPIR